MRPCNCPLEDLAGFAFVLCFGALLALALSNDLRSRQERVFHAHR